MSQAKWDHLNVDIAVCNSLTSFIGAQVDVQLNKINWASNCSTKCRRPWDRIRKLRKGAVDAAMDVLFLVSVAFEVLILGKLPLIWGCSRLKRVKTFENVRAST